MVEISNRISGPVEAHELRSVAQLRMLHALATRLNALDDVAAIGEAITTELKTLIDYHNCRIYLLLEDGLTLWPVTFRGELTEYESETPEELVTQVGEGITGYARDHGTDVLRARRALRQPGPADRRHRRDRRIAPGRTPQGRRQGDRRHRSLQARGRSVRGG